MMKFLEAAGLFADCWNVYRKYYGKELNDDICEKFIGEMELLYEKYEKQRLAKELILAVIGEIERVDDVQCCEKRAISDMEE